MLVAVLFAAAGAIWHSMAGSVKLRAAAVALALALFAFVFYNGTAQRHRHPLRQGPEAEAGRVRRNGTASRASPCATTPSSSTRTLPPASPASISRTSPHRERHELLEQGPALPYAVRPGAKTLVIGPGGGWDVARALASGSHDITGRRDQPHHRHHRDARSIRGPEPAASTCVPTCTSSWKTAAASCAAATEKYQVVQATLVDTWASTAAGAFALSENNLYTTDALRDYLLHLTDDGMVAFTRWGLDPPRESLRLVSLAMAALNQLGETEPWRHVIVGRDRVHRRLGRAGYRADLAQAVQRRRSGPRARRLGRRRTCRPSTCRTSASPASSPICCAAPIRPPTSAITSTTSTPVTDNQPFFFYTVQPRDILAFLAHASRRYGRLQDQQGGARCCSR